MTSLHLSFLTFPFLAFNQLFSHVGVLVLILWQLSFSSTLW